MAKLTQPTGSLGLTGWDGIGLLTRASIVLYRDNIPYEVTQPTKLGELVPLSEQDALSVENLGGRVLAKISGGLEEQGLSFGMPISDDELRFLGLSRVRLLLKSNKDRYCFPELKNGGYFEKMGQPKVLKLTLKEIRAFSA